MKYDTEAPSSASMTLRMPRALMDRIDADRGRIPRTYWILDVIEEALKAPVKS